MGRTKEQLLDREFAEAILDPEVELYTQEQDEYAQNIFIEDLNSK